jgi:hypothetical protein
MINAILRWRMLVSTTAVEPARSSPADSGGSTFDLSESFICRSTRDSVICCKDAQRLLVAQLRREALVR